MGFNLSKIPERLRSGAAGLYYAAHKSPAGEWVAVSDDDPKDDVRNWSNFASALSSAKTWSKWCRIDAIIFVHSGGRQYLDMDGTVMEPSSTLEPDGWTGEDILVSPDGLPTPPRYADFGSW
jgi:hypothetical protein